LTVADSFSAKGSLGASATTGFFAAAGEAFGLVAFGLVALDAVFVPEPA